MRLVDPNSRWAEQCLNEDTRGRLLLDHERATPDTGRVTARIVFVVTVVAPLIATGVGLVGLVTGAIR